MADDTTDPGTGADYPTCTVGCSTIDCKKTCCKENTPNHSLYGIHACSDHK